MPAPERFTLKWRDGAYRVNQPNVLAEGESVEVVRADVYDAAVAAGAKLADEAATLARKEAMERLLPPGSKGKR